MPEQKHQFQMRHTSFHAQSFEHLCVMSYIISLNRTPVMLHIKMFQNISGFFRGSLSSVFINHREHKELIENHAWGIFEFFAFFAVNLMVRFL
jgi:hypothetical protein